MRQIIYIALFIITACSEPISTGPTFGTAEPVHFESAPAENQEPASEPDSSRYEWEILSRQDDYRVRVTNNGDSVHVGLACYAGPPTDLDSQELHDHQIVSLGAGSAAELSASIPCGQWQCDVFEGQVPEEPPYFGSRLILGRVGVQECALPPAPPEPPDGTDDPFPVPEPPKPPPGPPPVCGPDDSISDTEDCLWNEDTCSWECPPPVCEPQDQAPENCLWNEQTCAWECPTSDDCDPPQEQAIQLDRPIGNPGEECAFFGDYAPATNHVVFWIAKCGNFYEVTHAFPASGTCSNGQDVSHRTACGCEVKQ